MMTHKEYKQMLEANQFYFETSCGRHLAVTVKRDNEPSDYAMDLDSNEMVSIDLLYGVDAPRISVAAWNFVFPQENLDD